MKAALLGVGLIIGVGAVLLIAHYLILFNGNCERPDHHRVSRFRGQVVGRSLGLLQYRWLRRRFNASGTQLILTKPLPDSYYEGNLVRNSAPVGERVIGPTGTFDFGELPPGEYSLLVELPGQASAGFGFSIDPAASHSEVLIDASPAYYCRCCGWDFEPR